MFDPTPDFSPEAIAELRSKWERYADRLREGDGGGSLVGAAYIIAKTAVADIPTLLAALEAARAARAKTQQRLTAAQDLLDAVSDEMVSFTAEWHAPEIVAAFAALNALTDPDGRIDR